MVLSLNKRQNLLKLQNWVVLSFYQREKEASPKSKKFQLDLEYRHKGGYMSDIQTFSKVEGCREASFSLFVGKKTKRLSLAVLTNSVFYSKIKPLSKSELLFPLTVLCHLKYIDFCLIL